VLLGRAWERGWGLLVLGPWGCAGGRGQRGGDVGEEPGSVGAATSCRGGVARLTVEHKYQQHRECGHDSVRTTV